MNSLLLNAYIPPSSKLDAMRKILSMPPRSEQCWINMSDAERESVLVAAGLPPQWKHRFWRHLLAREQIKIMGAVDRMSRWAQRLQGPE